MGLDMRFLGGNCERKKEIDLGASPFGLRFSPRRSNCGSLRDDNKKRGKCKMQRRNTGILGLRGSQNAVSHFAQTMLAWVYLAQDDDVGCGSPAWGMTWGGVGKWRLVVGC